MKGLKLLAMLLALTCCLSACAGGGDVSTTPSAEGSSAPAESSAPETSEEETLGEFKTVFRFLVTSDNHVSATTDASAQRLA